MAENPTCKPPDGAHVTVREYFTLWLTQFENMVDEKFTMTDKALVLSEKALAVRLENMNEWRQTYDDRDNTYFTLAAHVAYQEKTDTAIQALQITGAELRGKADQKSLSIAFALTGFSLLIGACGISLSVITLILHYLSP